MSNSCIQDGQQSFIGFTVTELADCTTTIPDNVQDQIPVHTVDRATATAHAMLTQKTAEEVPWSVGSSESPRTVDAAGTPVNKRFNRFVSHEAMTINFEWPWEQDFDMLRLAAVQGTLRKHGPDGSHYQGKAKVTGGLFHPILSEEETIGRIVFEWLGSDANPITYTPPA